MFKVLVSSLVLAVTTAIAQAPHPTLPTQSKEEGYVYTPEPDFREIPEERVLVQPKKPGMGNGAAQWCDTLRGKGMVAIAIDNKLIFIAIDCPEQKMRDI